MESRRSKEERPMKDNYLWDGSGEPDPEIQKLETALGRFRHQGTAPEFPEIAGSGRSLVRPRISPIRLSFGLAAAAAIILAVVAYSFLSHGSNLTTATRPGWDVERTAGTPRVGWTAIGKNGKPGKLGIGQTLVTDGQSRATISLSEIGEVQVEPNTRLRVVAKAQGNKRLSLERGTIHAAIWAPPGDFVVDTPSAVAVDLGCAYTLVVDDSGAGLLRTTLGWVGFKLNGHESFIPAGAVCATRPKVGPGIPYFEDASAEFRAALTRFDFGVNTPAERNTLLGILLVDARKKDALSLWHLLSRVSDVERPGVYDRLAAIAPPPAGVTREGILRLDQTMLDSWWNSLGF